MSHIISIHSFRGGTGKSNTSANIAATLAAQGLRVGVIDTDIQSPGIHVLFGLDETTIDKSLNGYLLGKYPLAEAVYDVTDRLGAGVKGKLFLVPCSVKAADISQITQDGFDPRRLNEGFEDFIEARSLDVLVVDTHPGLSDEILLTVAVSDTLGIILRPDQQDYQGTHVMAQVARRLGVPQIQLIVNKTPTNLELQQVKAEVERSYGLPVAAVFPHSNEMMKLASSGVFVVHHPDHAVTGQVKQLVGVLMQVPETAEVAAAPSLPLHPTPAIPAPAPSPRPIVVPPQPLAHPEPTPLPAEQPVMVAAAVPSTPIVVTPTPEPTRSPQPKPESRFIKIFKAWKTVLDSSGLTRYLYRIPLFNRLSQESRTIKNEVGMVQQQQRRVTMTKDRANEAWALTTGQPEKQSAVSGQQSAVSSQQSAVGGQPLPVTSSQSPSLSVSQSPSLSVSQSPNPPVSPSPIPHSSALYAPLIGRIPVPPEFAVNLPESSKAREFAVLGRRIERYQVDAIIADGHLSSIYQAYDMKLNRLVAVKVMVRPGHFSQAQVEQFLDKIRALAATDHPNLVHIYDYGAAQGHIFFVTELVRGLPIDAYMKHLRDQGQEMSPKQIILALAYTASALADAHALGELHGHLKPGHLLLEPHPVGIADVPFHLELLDTGLGTLYEKVADMPPVMWPYLSPEHGRQPLTPQSDVYSLGALLYHLSTGHLPFQPQSVDEAMTFHAQVEPPAPTAVSDTLPLLIEAIILKAMAKDPAQRYQGAGEMAQALRAAANQMTDEGLATRSFRPGDIVLTIETEGAPRRTILLDRATMFLGRASDNDVILSGARVAPYHVRLERTEENIIVYDLTADFDTFLQGTLLLPNLPEIWDAQQYLQVGPYFLKWEEIKEARTDAPVLLDQIINHLVGVQIQPAAAAVTPGQFVDVQLSLINQAAHIDHFHVQVQGIPTEWVKISNNDLFLLPGDRGRVLLNIAPPLRSDIAAADYPFAVQVIPRTYPTYAITTEAVLTINPVVKLTSTLQPERLRNRGPFTLQLRNEGNAPTTCNLMLTEAQAGLLLTHTAQEFVLAGGEEKQITIQAEARQRPFVGASQTFPWQAELVYTPAPEPAIHPAQVEVTPQIPAWFVAIVMPLFILLCLVGTLFLTSYLQQRALETALAAQLKVTATPTLVVVPTIPTATPAPPGNCAEIRARDRSARDGEYEIFLARDLAYPVTIYCHNMDSAPREYLTLAQTGETVNFSSIVYPDRQIRTVYSRVRLNLATLTIDRTDHTFSTVSGEGVEVDEWIRDYGTAIGCDSAAAAAGQANIDLTGTVFALNENVQFVTSGQGSAGSDNTSPDRQQVNLTVTGNCGWIWPQDELRLIYLVQSSSQ